MNAEKKVVRGSSESEARELRLPLVASLEPERAPRRASHQADLRGVLQRVPSEGEAVNNLDVPDLYKLERIRRSIRKAHAVGRVWEIWWLPLRPELSKNDIERIKCKRRKQRRLDHERLSDSASNLVGADSGPPEY